MKIKELLHINEALNLGENKFDLWEPNAYCENPVLTLRSKYGFRRFEIKSDMELEEAQKKAIEIDEALCTNPVADKYKKLMGLSLIPLE